MGLGIAEVAARGGLEVVVVRASGGDPSAARARFDKAVQRHVTKGRLSAEDADALCARVRFESSLDTLKGVDLAIESATEDMKSKSALLDRMEAALTEGAVLATNTSSLSLSALATGLKRPQQFLALHFFNPAPVMKLVEIAGTHETAPGVLASARAFVKAVGKTPVEVAPTPGYVVNRLLVPLILHAMESLEEGIASADDIDQAMKLGCGHPMGPLELADLIGLDVVMAMASTLLAKLQDSRYRIPSLLRRLVNAGHLGLKSGRGIYVYGEGERHASEFTQIHRGVHDAAE